MPIQSITHLWPFYSASTEPNLTTMGIWQTVIWWHLWGRKKKKDTLSQEKNQALDSTSSSISRTDWRGPLPNVKPLSEADSLFKGSFPNKHTCGSIWFKRFHSSSDRDQLKMSMFFLIRSGFKLQGRTLVPLCSPQRRITCV